MVSISKTNSEPYYEQLMLSVKEEIINGLLKPGDKLPSVRELARQLMMNPNTVSKAYKLLEAQDVIVTVKGKGTYIKAVEQHFRNDSQLLKLKKRLNDLVIEANYLTISKEEMITWLDDIYEDLKGA